MRPPRRLFTRSLAVFTFGALLGVATTVLGSCDGVTERSVSGTYVGRVAGSNAFAVVVTNGTDVRAYVCDGAADGRLTVSEWFKGVTTGRTVASTSESGGARLTAEFAPETASGSVRLADGRVLTFTAAREDGDGPGFYLFKTQRAGEWFWGGWIVLPGGDMRGSTIVHGATTANTTLSVPRLTAQLPTLGVVTPAKLTTTNTVQGFNGCFGCGSSCCR